MAKFDKQDNTPIRKTPPPEPGSAQYVRFKEQSWCKIIGRKCVKGSEYYNKNFLDWCYNTMTHRDKLPPESIKYLKKVLALKWKELDRYEKREAKLALEREAKND